MFIGICFRGSLHSEASYVSFLCLYSQPLISVNMSPESTSLFLFSFLMQALQQCICLNLSKSSLFLASHMTTIFLFSFVAFSVLHILPFVVSHSFSSIKRPAKDCSNWVCWSVFHFVWKKAKGFVSALFLFLFIIVFMISYVLP